MKIAGFEFSESARFQSGATKDANAVGNHLEQLRRQLKGEITPLDVVNDARSNNSPLHPYFEWDDGEAAEQYRLSQARGLIRSVVAIYTSDKAPAVRQKAYVHINEPEAPHYRESSHAMSTEKTRSMVLQSAWRELQSWRKRYKDLKEFSDLFGEIDQLKLPKTGSK